MYKICAIGDKDSVLGFMAAGFDVFMTEDLEEIKDIIKSAKDNSYAVIYITEDIAASITDFIDKYKSEPIPAIVPIPSKTGSLGIGMSAIKSSVERAVGADILFKDN